MFGDSTVAPSIDTEEINTGRGSPSWAQREANISLVCAGNRGGALSKIAQRDLYLEMIFLFFVFITCAFHLQMRRPTSYVPTVG